MQVEDDVDHDGDDEEEEGDHGKDVDLVADALEVFEEFLLLEGCLLYTSGPPNA